MPVGDFCGVAEAMSQSAGLVTTAAQRVWVQEGKQVLTEAGEDRNNERDE
jgi:hypothetical protein